MSIWTIAKDGDFCGYDGQRIVAGAPMQLVGPESLPLRKRLKRCQSHAYGPVDWAQVDAAKFRAETKAEREAISVEDRRFNPERTLPRDRKSAAAGDREP